MQATQWLGATSRHSGIAALQSAIAIGQRVWNTHPAGGRSGEGTSPVRMMRSRVRSSSGSVIGIAESSALVYGCSGFSYSSSESASSMMCPRYITAMRSEMCRTTARSCAMNR